MSTIEVKENTSKPEQKELPVEWLIRGSFQPRHFFDETALQELANSIREHGLIEPIVVRQKTPQQYEIIAGERRWRAAQLAGFDTIRCEVRELRDDQVAAITIIENIQREDLNPIEEARGYQRLQEEFGYIHEEIAAEVGVSRVKITNSMRLLKLIPEVQEMLIQGTISGGHGKVLAGLPAENQRKLAGQCAARGWSVRKIEQEAKRAQKQSSKAQNTKDPDLKHMEMALAEHLGSPVSIDFDGVCGILEVTWNNIDILDGVLKRMGFESNA